MELSKPLVFLVEHLDLPEAVGDPEASWEAFQLKHLNNPSLLAIEDKSRQVGWSWTAAAESVAIACLEKRSNHIFVSINQEEASEKIRYAKQVIEALDREVRPKLLTDNQLALELTNGSRLISHPCRPVRGKAKAHVYLDEFAHYPNDKEIYQSALPAITKGGCIRIGSSPLGARGMFWEIYTESMRTYPGYVRDAIPWWVTRSLCKDVRLAALVCPSLDTETRVRQFGTARLLQIYENSPLDDFQQEYECAWLDESVSWIDWDLIKRNQQMAADGKLHYRKVKGVNEALAAIDALADDISHGAVEDQLVGGLDIGRVHDLTELVLLGKSRWSPALPYRLGISLDRVEFADQEAVVNRALEVLPITGLLMDRTGIGRELAEKISANHPQAEGVDFTNGTKEIWAVEAKLKCQRAEAPLPMDRDIAYQIHSIKRKITAAKNSVYDTSENEKHHADKFWAWALALWAGRMDDNQTEVGSNPLRGQRG